MAEEKKVTEKEEKKTVEKEEKKVIQKKKVKGKTWFKIHAPKIFNERDIGETIGNDSDSIKGRILSLPLSEVTGDITKHYIKIGLKIVDVKGIEAYTEPVDYNISRQYFSRLVRRRSSKIEVINDVKLKDEQTFRIKTVVVTAYKADSRQKSSLHRAVHKEMEKRASQLDFPSLIIAFSTGKIQKEIGEIVRKIFPLKTIEVRKVELHRIKKGTEKIDKKEPETEEAPVEETEETA